VVAEFRDDEQLVTALRQGDESAFGWLLDEYSALLRRLARSFVSTDAAADEVVQETWLAVITGIDRFEQRASVKTWLCRILSNIARSRGVRDQRTVPFASLDGTDDERAVSSERFQDQRGRWPGHWASAPVAWDEEPLDRLLADETLRAVRDAIGRLPAGQQAVITLRDVEGWPSEEVCNALDISETNQRVLLHRARSRVRQTLEIHLAEAQT
jgi:RNA polymerase sigma-70 factor, ECF subfamily